MLAELRMTMDEPPHFNELCRQVGCVVLQAQLIESTLAAYLATSLRLEKSEAMTQVQAALEQFMRVITVRLETMKIVRGLPGLGI